MCYTKHFNHKQPRLEQALVELDYRSAAVDAFNIAVK